MDLMMAAQKVVSKVVRRVVLTVVEMEMMKADDWVVCSVEWRVVHLAVLMG